MRLFFKFALLLVIGTTAQVALSIHSDDTREAWFATRCLFADVTGNAQMQESLVQEKSREMFGHLSVAR